MDSITPQISTECVDETDGRYGVVVYDDIMYSLPSQQAAAAQGLHRQSQGLHSSVRPFQFPCYENDDGAVNEESLETDGGSLTSHVKRHENKSGRVKQNPGHSGL